MGKYIILFLLVFNFNGLTIAQTLSSKFIPTFLIKYCDAKKGQLSASETAKYDLIIVAPSHHHTWAEGKLNSWETLKKYNPKIKIALYKMGPAVYNDASWGKIGEGWDWIKKTHGHGENSRDQRWVESGYKSDYLHSAKYPNEHLMNIGNIDWLNYWIEANYKEFRIDNYDNYKEADAIFADNTSYKVIWQGKWFTESKNGILSVEDHPIHYASDSGKYNNEKWRKDMRTFLNISTKAFSEKPQPLKLIPNFGYSGTNPEFWNDIDNLNYPLMAAMEEEGFISSWGKPYEIKNWEQKVQTLKSMKQIPILSMNLGKNVPGVGLSKMDSIMKGGNMGSSTGWDALWFSMTSFLMGLNPEKTNGYFGFTVWSYCENYWLDEFDPRYLHLGKPINDYYIVNGVAFREYEDGWVVTNSPVNNKELTLEVPKGKASVVNHDNFKSPDSHQFSTKFKIGKNRGIILLKKGRQIGNNDNL